MIPIGFGRAAVFLACVQAPPAPVGPELAVFGRRYNATGTGRVVDRCATSKDPGGR